MSLAVILACGLSVAVPVMAVGNAPALLFQTPSDGKQGSEAGQLDGPRGLAASPKTGHIFVADNFNARLSEFTIWGEFVKAWGWGVLDGSAEPQVCTAETGCQKGIEGSGPGQLATLNGVATDAVGDIYVVERASHRVSKFDPDGGFLLMFGGEVNKTTGANVCTRADLEGGDECGIGVLGPASGQFNSEAVGNYIAVSPTGTVYVGDKDRIQEFNPDGSFKSQISFAGDLDGKTVKALAVDPATGNLYVVLEGMEDIHRLSPAGAPTGEPLKAKSPRAVAVDSKGDVYVIVAASEAKDPELEKKEPVGQVAHEVIGFDSSGKATIEVGARFAASPASPSIFNRIELIGLATNSACGLSGDDIYTSAFKAGLAAYVRAYGPPPQDVENCPPPEVPPTIQSQYAVSVDGKAATVRAEINPNFWPDTRYYVEYGTGKCSEGGCPNTQPLPPGSLLTDKVIKAPLTTAGVLLDQLQPETTYHYRFVAQSSGGGPVRGEGGTLEADGEEGIFQTFPAPKSPPNPDPCSNASFRAGASAFLPDCRAFELVSPVDKGGSDISVLFSARNNPAELNQSAVDGEHLAYSSQRAFGDAISIPWTSQYLATRIAGKEWSTHGISPPRETLSVTEYQPAKFDVQFKAFSADLCQGWVLHDSDPVLAPGAIEDFLNFYRRQNCGEESYEAVTISEPQNATPNDYWPELQGLSADGSHTVFRANAKLTEDASSKEESGLAIYQLYEYFEGKLRLVSVLPGGEASEVGSSAGTANPALAEGRANTVSNAVSDDGSRIYWTAEDSGPGPLYVRVDDSPLLDGDEQTVQVSPGPARFWTASSDGAIAIYEADGNLHEFDLLTETSQPIAVGSEGVLGASEDASRVYFVSEEELDEGGVDGEPNLYLYEAGEPSTYSFIGTLSDADVNVALPFAAVSPAPIGRSSRVSPDGLHAAFMSTALLTGYDNRDLGSGEADAEVFLYSAAGDDLVCVSCNASGARPVGRSFKGIGATGWAAAQLPTWASQLYAPRALADDGSRLFFESFDPLVPRDSNGKQDVYEWSRASGKAACEDTGAELFVASAAGCLSLISSGQSDQDSEFVDATPTGSDVFFKTGSSLVPHDPGLVDIYDARVEGGLPVPVPPKPSCQGEACQAPPVPPQDATPSSSSYVGPGSPLQAKPKPKHCPKGKRKVKVKGKVRCVPRKREGKAQANRSGGARR